MEPTLHQVRHDLLGKLNALTLCANVLDKLDSPEMEIEFLDMLIDAADRCIVALDAYETAARNTSSHDVEPNVNGAALSKQFDC